MDKKTKYFPGDKDSLVEMVIEAHSTILLMRWNAECFHRANPEIKPLKHLVDRIREKHVCFHCGKQLDEETVMSCCANAYDEDNFRGVEDDN